MVRPVSPAALIQLTPSRSAGSGNAYDIGVEDIGGYRLDASRQLLLIETLPRIILAEATFLRRTNLQRIFNDQDGDRLGNCASLAAGCRVCAAHICQEASRGLKRAWSSATSMTCWMVERSGFSEACSSRSASSTGRKAPFKGWLAFPHHRGTEHRSLFAIRNRGA